MTAPLTAEGIVSRLIAKVDDALRDGATMLNGKDLIMIRNLLNEKAASLAQERAGDNWGPLIEAAKRIDKALAIKTLNRLYHPMFQEKGRPVSVPIFDSIMPLLEAIPDKGVVVEGEEK